MHDDNSNAQHKGAVDPEQPGTAPETTDEARMRAVCGFDIGDTVHVHDDELGLVTGTVTGLNHESNLLVSFNDQPPIVVYTNQLSIEDRAKVLAADIARWQAAEAESDPAEGHADAAEQGFEPGVKYGVRTGCDGEEIDPPPTQGEIEMVKATLRAYPREDWRYEVTNGDTKLGYHEWLLHKWEADAHSREAIQGNERILVAYVGANQTNYRWIDRDDLRRIANLGDEAYTKAKYLWKESTAAEVSNDDTDYTVVVDDQESWKDLKANLDEDYGPMLVVPEAAAKAIAEIDEMFEEHDQHDVAMENALTQADNQIADLQQTLGDYGISEQHPIALALVEIRRTLNDALDAEEGADHE